MKQFALLAVGCIVVGVGAGCATGEGDIVGSGGSGNSTSEGGTPSNGGTSGDGGSPVTTDGGSTNVTQPTSTTTTTTTSTSTGSQMGCTGNQFDCGNGPGVRLHPAVRERRRRSSHQPELLHDEHHVDRHRRRLRPLRDPVLGRERLRAHLRDVRRLPGLRGRVRRARLRQHRSPRVGVRHLLLRGERRLRLRLRGERSGLRRSERRLLRLLRRGGVVQRDGVPRHHQPGRQLDLPVSGASP